MKTEDKSQKMKFELTNKQRKVFGIEPIDSNWDRIKLNNFASIYFDKNNVIRRLISYENGYIEREYDIQTDNRKVLKPRTKRGKPKKLSYSTIIYGPKPINVGFTYFEDQYAYNTNFNVDRTLFNSCFVKAKLSWEELKLWIEGISNSMNDDLLKEIQAFKDLKRKRVKYKPGDLFAFRIDVATYGFGQILLNINKIRDQFTIYNNASLGSVFGASVLARVFCTTSNDRFPSIEELSSSTVLPSFILRDNQIHYGEYEIVGHLELKESDFDFPISFGLANNVADPNHYLHYGFVTKTRRKEETPKVFIQKDGKKDIDSPYRGNSSIGVVPFSINELRKTQEKGIDWFWNNVHFFIFEDDLRNPKNSKIRNRIFEHFQLNPKHSYDQIRRNNKIQKTLAIIKDSA